MILKEYIHNAKFEDVWEKLITYYPDQEKNKEGYQKAWDEINNLPISTEDYTYNIFVELIHDDEYPEDDYWAVDGYVEGCQFNYGLEHTEWTKWLGMPIDEQTIIKYSKEFVLAHILWVMTWESFDYREIGKKMIEWSRD